MAQIDEVFNFNLKRAHLNIAIYEMEKKSNKLNHQNSTLQYKINLYLEKLSVYRLLENHGLGHLELETLLKIILYIAIANGVPYWLAVDKIFNDIRTQYAPKLDFESKIEDLKLDIQIISEEKDKKLDELKYLPFVCLTVSQLYALGLKGTEILQLGQIYHAILNKTYSVEDLATAIIKTIDVMSYLANKSEAIHNDKVAGILSRVREDLSQIHYTS